MIVKQRSAEILKLLMDGGAMSVSQLAERLDVSEMTIRRDLAKLKKDGAVRLVNGVAFCSKGSEPFAYDLAQQLGVNCRAKDAIGRVAASLLVPGDSVYFTDMAGSTTEYAAASVEQRDPSDAEGVRESGYPLVLYTCSWDCTARVTVFCGYA